MPAQNTCFKVHLLIVFAAAASPARADMVIRKDGTVHAGRIRSQDVQRVVIAGGEGASKGTAIPRAEIQSVWTGNREIEHIAATKKVGLLRQWAGAYSAAGLDSLAVRCIDRAIALDPRMRQKPRSDGDRSFRAFWNRTVLRRLSAEAELTDGSAHVKNARWAHQAGLNDEARRLLRLAWIAERSSQEVRALAKDWGVQLGGPMRIDLSPALTGSVLMDSIDDEGVHVPAASERIFLLVPVRYSARSEKLSLSKTTLGVRDARSMFYGLRPLTVVNGGVQLAFGPKEPIYERIDITSGPAGGSHATLRNSGRPRVPEGDTTPYERIGPREQSIPASGWAAFILEVPKSVETIVVQLDDGPPQDIELPYLRNLQVQLSESGSDVVPPELTAILERIQRFVEQQPPRTGALASLAIEQLMQIRNSMRERIRPAWARAMDAAVLRAGSAGDLDVSVCVLRYFDGTRLDETIAGPLFGKANLSQLLNWVDAAMWGWDTLGPSSSPTASQVLGFVLKDERELACDAALEALIRMGSQADWTAVGSPSSTAQRLAAMRLPGITDRTVAARMLTALARGMSADRSTGLAEHAERIGLRPVGPEDPLLAIWPTLRTADAQISYLNILRAADLQLVWYSQPIVRILGEATAATSDQRVRDEAFALVEKSLSAGSASLPGFPLVVARDSNDPDIVALTNMARAGPIPRRVAAIQLLLQAGFADEVKRFLSDGQSTSDDAMAILDELAKSASNEQSREALAGLLGVMLEVDDQNVAARAVVHLGRLAGNAGPDWLWRLCARVRSGVRIEALSRLSERMDPAESGAALRWLFEITHMTTQERQRFVGVSDSKERLAELNTIDVRRGQLVDGKYGVLAVMETSVAAAGFEGQCMWTPPVRSTVVLPPLSLDLDIDQDRYAVRFGDTVLGHGLGVAQDHTPKATAYYYGLVESLDGGPFAVKATTQPMDGPGTGSIARYGPLVLPSMRASQTPARGEMTLDLAGYLNAALPSVGAASPPIEPADVPITLPITLRYFRFGGYVGAAERRPFPKKTKPGDRHFLNIMLILERIEEDGVQ